jgi:hypothetical protein
MLELQPLSDQETADVVTNLLDAAELPPAAALGAAGAGGGNPLFARSTCGCCSTAGCCAARGLGAGADGSDLPLPESVQSIIAARLDALPSDEKPCCAGPPRGRPRVWLGALAEVGQRQRWSVEHLLYELER